MNIAVFDSGVGGTSVLDHLQSKLPHTRFYYFMDNLYRPYGKLTLSTLHKRLLAKLRTAIQMVPTIDLIVVACNTASTQGLDFLRASTNIPIVGVVPAIKPASAMSQKSVGLLATPATVKSAYVNNLVEQYVPDKPVYLYGSTELVHLAEEKFWKGSVSLSKVRRELQALSIHQDVDCLVLGCTHFPILKEEIQAILGESVQLIDSGSAIAERVFFY
ncbi:glutamate racemase [Marinomonas sp. 2405UD68-3]|uniref:glutamate racemase n=1 Tax=Marinomonas sp. 2405UD68-3 TaxID=3391835 RepID=UPI0039C95A4B